MKVLSNKFLKVKFSVIITCTFQLFPTKTATNMTS